MGGPKGPQDKTEKEKSLSVAEFVQQQAAQNAAAQNAVKQDAKVTAASFRLCRVLGNSPSPDPVRLHHSVRNCSVSD